MLIEAMKNNKAKWGPKERSIDSKLCECNYHKSAINKQPISPNIYKSKVREEPDMYTTSEKHDKLTFYLCILITLKTHLLLKVHEKYREHATGV